MQLCAATCDQTRLHRMPNTVRNWRPPKSNPVITRSVAISAQAIVALSTAAMEHRATIVHTTSSQCISSSSFASIYKRERENQRAAHFILLNLFLFLYGVFLLRVFVPGNHEKLFGNYRKITKKKREIMAIYREIMRNYREIMRNYREIHRRHETEGYYCSHNVVFAVHLQFQFCKRYLCVGGLR